MTTELLQHHPFRSAASAKCWEGEKKVVSEGEDLYGGIDRPRGVRKGKNYQDTALSELFQHDL